MLEKENILLIDDDTDVLQAYQALLEVENYQTRAISNPYEALNIIPPNWQGVVISDIYMPQLSGWELLEKIREKDKNLPVILITGHGDIPMAIEAMKKGAFYFIEKPVDPEKLLEQIKQALSQRKAQLKVQLWQQEELETYLIGQSLWIKKLRIYLQQLADTDLPVFISGEIGTGRSLNAHYLHKLAQERYPHKKVVELFSVCEFSELQQSMEQLKHGVLIIKNIEFLSSAAQKLLAQYIHSKNKNIRFIAISQHSLTSLLTEFNLLPELFYEFSLTHIECLPLSHRTADIEPLFRHYLEATCKKLNKKKPVIRENIIKKLQSQQWHGNINQLIRTAELYAVGIQIKDDNLQFISDSQSELSLDILLDEYEKNIITDILDRFQGKINEAANYLQIPRKKLYLRMKKYGLDKAHYK